MAHGQEVSSTVQNFGNVKQWDNPIFEVSYTNTSGRSQLFLPIRYQPDIGVSFSKERLAPGESTIIQIQYYTEEFGRFSQDVAVFISTQNDPITFTLRGNIQSFHPDAFTMCPRIDNSGLVSGPGFNHTIKVIDVDTKEPLTDYEIVIATKSSKETIQADKSTVILKREKPGFYYIKVDKEEYEVSTIDKYINRNTSETVFALKREPNIEEEQEEDIVAMVPEVPVDIRTETPVEDVEEDDADENGEDEEEEDDGDGEYEEEDGEYFDWDNPNNEEIATKEPEEQDLEEEPIAIAVPEPIDTADFTSDGTLNTSKYAYNHIIFLIDVSTSMRNADKLPLLQASMLQMIAVLRPEDQVSIITYSTEAVVAVSNVSGAQKTKLNEAISVLKARGQSYGQEGVDMAYDLAKEHFITDGNNEIILASDGFFNSKNFSENKLYRQAMYQRKIANVRLSTIAFGNSTKALTFMETLARKGNGSFIRIQEGEDSEAVLISNLIRHSTK
ncbi:MAG: Ca-activated chloride channel family protein [Bacteroidia bacterium]